MTRLLILIFALNAFIMPVLAMGVCDMMDDSNTMMSSSMSSVSDAHCGIDADAVCSSIECASNCAATIIPLALFENQTTLIVAGNSHPQASFSSFYKITPPVNTPPPLV